MAVVLVVDDNATDRRLLAAVLGPAGHRVIETADAHEGLRLAAEQTPDLIVSDILMPAMDGYEFARLLRAEPATADARLVFYSASFDERRVAKLAAACGALGVIPKPAEPTVILAEVERALASGRSGGTLASPEQFDREHLRVITNRLFEKVREVDEANRELRALRDALEIRARQQEAVARLGRSALETRDVARLMREAVAIVAEVVDAEHATILELLPGERELLLREGTGWPEGVLGTTVAAGSDSQAGYTLQHGGAVVVEDWETETRFGRPAALRADGIVSGLTVPIAGGERAFGVLGVQTSRRRRFSEDDVNFLVAVAHVVGETVRRAHQDEMLRRSERLGGLGQLAGGIAHDFNNIIAVILAYASLAKEDGVEGQLGQFVDQMIGAAERGAALTRQLLAFARPEPGHPEVLDLRRTVEGMEQLLGRTLGEEIALGVESEPGLWPVRVDPSQIDMVILNLAVNARDAIGGPGTLRIRLQNVEAGPGSAEGLEPGRYVCLAVVDTGAGMTEEVRSRALDPFFSTKSPGRGTGLGLAAVYGVARRAGGTVTIESEPARGTAVRVYLPAAQGAPSAAGPDAGAAPAGGTERIVVVEDDDDVRAAAATILARAGYDVTCFGNPADALASAPRAAAVDLLLSDVVMPRMSGPDLAARLRESIPGLRVLFMSGYFGDERLRSGGLEPGAHLLEKPFDAARLLREVRAALDAPA